MIVEASWATADPALAQLACDRGRRGPKPLGLCFHVTAPGANDRRRTEYADRMASARNW